MYYMRFGCSTPVLYARLLLSSHLHKTARYNRNVVVVVVGGGDDDDDDDYYDDDDDDDCPFFVCRRSIGLEYRNLPDRPPSLILIPCGLLQRHQCPEEEKTNCAGGRHNIPRKLTFDF